jgi:hypothetical protein
MKSWQAVNESLWPPSENMKTTSLKDWRKVYERIKHVRGLDEHGKILYARSLAATPDERWQMNETYLRSFGLWGRSALKTFVSN